MDAYLYLDGEFKLWKIATTAELPKRGGGEVHHKRFFLLHLLPFKVPDGMKLPRSILTCSCSFLLICMCLRINVQFGGNFLRIQTLLESSNFSICARADHLFSQPSSPRFRLNLSSSCRRADRYNQSFRSIPLFKMMVQDFEFLAFWCPSFVCFLVVLVDISCFL